MIAIVVVLYNKEFRHSKTLNELLHVNKKFKSQITLEIDNNGPGYLNENDVFINELLLSFKKVVIRQHIQNLPLSIVYNSFIKNNILAKKFVFFDDDTSVSDSYIKSIFKNTQCNIQVPVIKSSENENYYPLINGKPTYKQNLLGHEDTILTITSGLVLDIMVIKKVSAFYTDIFDERFALYGVDFNFFRRINFLRKNGSTISILICEELVHSLSRVDEEYSSWREKERIIDVILTEKYYGSKRKYLCVVVLFILKNILKLRWKNVITVLFLIKNGMHPRSKDYI